MTLRWESTPDQVFQAILHQSLETALAEIEAFEEEGYISAFPHTARIFTWGEIRPLLRTLLDASRDETTLYEITDHHMLPLFECLEIYCDYHRDGLTGGRVGPYRIGDIDFTSMVDHYLPDLDFITPDFADVPEQVKRMIGMRAETWGVLQGLKPHPDELRLTPCPGRSTPAPGPRGKRVAVYPPRSSRSKWYEVNADLD